MPPIVEISKVSKSFQAPDGRTVDALAEILLDIPSGRFTTLLGPSGCGKTTLLRLIGGFEEPTRGGIFIDGVLMEGVPAHKRPTNTVFQQYGLFPHMTVEQNVSYGLEVARLSRKEIAARVGEALELVRLTGMNARPVTQLSGGQQQRVALARAIVLRPKILLLDEPMAALDRKLRKDMQVELKRLQHDLGIAFLCVTHDQEEALSMSDVVVVMNQGRVEQVGAPRAIYDTPQTRFVAEFVGEVSVFHGAVEPSSGTTSTLCTEAGTRITIAAPCPPTATVCLRPEKIRLATGSDDRGLCLTGRVLESIYLGTTTRLSVELADGERVLTTLPGIAPGEGEAVTLSYDPADVRVLNG